MKNITKVTSKFQTTIPEKVRKKLQLKENDMLLWEAEKDSVKIRPIRENILKLKNSIHVGEGDIEEDIELARMLMVEQNK